MDTLEKTVSHLIENQFPQIFREEGPMFVAFLRAYFEWMEEEGNNLFYTRRLPEIKDIDETLEEFIVHFKNTYLAKIPLNSHSDVRNLVKHSLDLYRSKGTERGVDLLFKLVYGQSIQVYYPSTDIFRLSDGEWIVPMYLEVSLSSTNNQFVNKQIVGLTSEATAFVERVVRRTIGPKIIDVFYISAIKGNFETGEKIQASDLSIDSSDCPNIIGSLTSIDIAIDGTGSGFAVGDIVDVLGDGAIGGKARVTSISDIVGTITFTLLDGGFGYTSQSNVLVSESVLTIANLTMNSTPYDYFQLFETITQPRADINYENSNGDFANGDQIFTYHANNLEKGMGYVYSHTEINSTAGDIKVFVHTGNLVDNAFYTAANAVGANQAIANGYTDRTASGNVMAISANLSIFVTNSVNNFAIGEVINIRDPNNDIVANGTILLIQGVSGANAQLFVVNTIGVFLPNSTVIGLTSNNQANLYS